ncbi:MAG: hypothetical protein AAGD13_00680 [Pseudomonadota bacterium]
MTEKLIQLPVRERSGAEQSSDPIDQRLSLISEFCLETGISADFVLPLCDLESAQEVAEQLDRLRRVPLKFRAALAAER